MPIGMKHKKKFLDHKLCFDTWIECGSVYKTRYILRDRYGIVNPNTGKLLTAMGVWGAAWNYVLENLVEARKSVELAWRANGEILTDVDWYKLVIGKAKYLYPPKKYAEFIEKHKYLTPYQ